MSIVFRNFSRFFEKKTALATQCCQENSRMQERVTLLDKTFQQFIPKEKILETIDQIAGQINNDFKNEDVLFICILNGAFMFASELFKRIENPNSEITFLKYTSYEGTCTTGKAKQLIGLNESLEGRNVIIAEDIVDTGITMVEVKKILKDMNPKCLKIAAMMYKPDRCNGVVDIDYPGLSIGNDFIVGFGLDYENKGRNLTDIYRIVEE